MKVNGYEIGADPTREEMAVWCKVDWHFKAMYVAEWLEGREKLTQDEFDELVSRFDEADFGFEESEYLSYEHERIVEERS